MKAKPKEIAAQIKAVAAELGWTLSVEGCVLTIRKLFTPGSNDEFVQADGEYYSILGLVPQTSAGSMWGTDGGGIGAISAIRSGVMTMHKSGCSKQVLKALL